MIKKLWKRIFGEKTDTGKVERPEPWPDPPVFKISCPKCGASEEWLSMGNEPFFMDHNVIMHEVDCIRCEEIIEVYYTPYKIENRSIMD